MGQCSFKHDGNLSHADHLSKSTHQYSSYTLYDNLTEYYLYSLDEQKQL